MTAAEPYAIVLDDHPLVGRGMAQYLQSVVPDLRVSVTTHWREAERLLDAQGCPQLLVADVWLSDGHCLQAVQRWCHERPSLRWLAISGDDDPELVRRVRAAGARGFVHKQAPPEAFAVAFQAVLGGGQWFSGLPPTSATGTLATSFGLTPRQGEILELLLRGLPNKRIASELGITEATVKEHVTAILSRLGVRTRIEAITALSGRRHAVQDHAAPRR